MNLWRKGKRLKMFQSSNSACNKRETVFKAIRFSFVLFMFIISVFSVFYETYSIFAIDYLDYYLDNNPNEIEMNVDGIFILYKIFYNSIVFAVYLFIFCFFITYNILLKIKSSDFIYFEKFIKISTLYLFFVPIIVVFIKCFMFECYINFLIYFLMNLYIVYIFGKSILKARG